MKQLSLSIVINAPIEAVWTTLITPELWWNNASLEPKEEGRFEERWGGTITRGVVTAFEPPKKLELSWKDEDWPGETSVRFLLTVEGGNVVLTLEHSGWDIFFKETASRLISAHKAGWESHMQDLKDAVENSR